MVNVKLALKTVKCAKAINVLCVFLDSKSMLTMLVILNVNFLVLIVFKVNLTHAPNVKKDQLWLETSVSLTCLAMVTDHVTTVVNVSTTT